MQDYPSGTLLYDEIRGELIRQLADIDGLNLKAGIIAGFDGVFLAAIIESVVQLHPQRTGQWCTVPSPVARFTFVVAIATILASTCTSIAAYWVTRYKSVLNPEGAYNALMSLSPNKSRLKLLHSFIDSYKQNKTAIKRKADLLRVTLILLGLGVFDMCLYLTEIFVFAS